MHHKSILFIIAIILLVGGFVLNDQMKVAPVGNEPYAVPSKEVVLDDGATYEMVASYVTKNISGKSVRMLAYNGMIPGPSITVLEGAQVTVNFVNNTDMPTLLHSHGIRMENPYDGTHLVQKDILPGESFQYILKFLDPGVFWYHPHVREDIQQNMGLYGNFVVRAKDQNFWAKADREFK